MPRLIYHHTSSATNHVWPLEGHSTSPKQLVVTSGLMQPRHFSSHVSLFFFFPESLSSCLVGTGVVQVSEPLWSLVLVQDWETGCIDSLRFSPHLLRPENSRMCFGWEMRKNDFLSKFKRWKMMLVGLLTGLSVLLYLLCVCVLFACTVGGDMLWKHPKSLNERKSSVTVCFVMTFTPTNTL